MDGPLFARPTVYGKCNRTHVKTYIEYICSVVCNSLNFLFVYAPGPEEPRSARGALGNPKILVLMEAKPSSLTHRI